MLILYPIQAAQAQVVMRRERSPRSSSERPKKGARGARDKDVPSRKVVVPK